MKSTNWKDVAELVGIAAILISLIFVGFQLQQSRIIAASEMNIALVSVGVESANLINDNIDIWTRGNNGGDLDEQERAVFNNIVSVLNTRWFVEHRHSTRLGEVEQAEAILDDWSSFLHQHPGARASWAEREANLQRGRELLNPDGDQFNYWSDAINTDLEILDRASE